jgi:hypothetical protein
MTSLRSLERRRAAFRNAFAPPAAATGTIAFASRAGTGPAIARATRRSPGSETICASADVAFAEERSAAPVAFDDLRERNNVRWKPFGRGQSLRRGFCAAHQLRSGRGWRFASSVASRNELLELLATAPTRDHDPALDEPPAVSTGERDPADPTSLASAAREGRDGARRSASLKRIPDRIPAQQLGATAGQSRGMWASRLPASGSPARLSRMRLAGGAPSRAPSTRDVKPCGRARSPSTEELPAARSRRRPALRTPLLEPRRAVAHGTRAPLIRRRDDAVLRGPGDEDSPQCRQRDRPF